jgi:hypothetical protein
MYITVRIIQSKDTRYLLDKFHSIPFHFDHVRALDDR